MTPEKREAILYLGRLLDKILDEALRNRQNKGRSKRMARLMGKAQELKEQFDIEFAEIGKEEARAERLLSTRK